MEEQSFRLDDQAEDVKGGGTTDKASQKLMDLAITGEHIKKAQTTI
jgi:hypothetical protein